MDTHKSAESNSSIRRQEFKYFKSYKHAFRPSSRTFAITAHLNNISVYIEVRTKYVTCKCYSVRSTSYKIRYCWFTFQYSEYC